MELRHTRLSMPLVGLLVLLLSVANAEFRHQYDNEITGEPEIECGYGVVHFTVHTAKGNASQVFVKGNADTPDCVFHNARNVTIDLTKCNIRRKREVNPSGVAYQLVVVVQLHKLFVTRVDRAYNVNCFYMEKQQRVGYEFGVSDLTTRMVQNDAPIPTCQYSVHRDSPNGPVIQFSKVGEVLYHVWTCESEMYAMLLSNCKVVDGKGEEYQLIDSNGCTTDEYLFPQITYSKDVTTAMVQTAAFNFPDRNTMYFNCKIRLCLKSDNCAAITPPQCDAKNGRLTTTDATLELAGHGDATTLTSDLDDEQLISSTTPNSFEAEGAGAEDEETTATAAAATTTTTTTTAAATSQRASGAKRRPTRPSTARTSRTTTSTTSTTGAPLDEDSRTAEDGDEEVTTAATSKAFVIPKDFPRPAFLPQGDDDGSGETASEIPEVDAWMASEEATAPTTRERRSNQTTAPVQLLKRARDSVLPSSSSSSGGTRQPSRQQRDATAAAGPKRTVDFDVTTPELTILEDYGPSGGVVGGGSGGGGGSGNEPATARQTLRELSIGGGFASADGVANIHGICFSPAAFICALGLIALFIAIIAIVLLKSRKITTAKFY